MLLHNDATNATKAKDTVTDSIGFCIRWQQIHMHEEAMKAESEQLVTWTKGAEIHWEHTVDG